MKKHFLSIEQENNVAQSNTDERFAGFVLS